MMPPWLWRWLIGDLAVLIPAEVSNERHQLALYTGYGEIAPQVTAGTPYTLLLLFTILSGLTCAIFAADVIATVFPQPRGRRVERRLGLAPAGADDDGAVLAEMQLFVGQYDPSIGLRVRTETDLNSLLVARTPAAARNDFDALMAATAAGLRHPPPGAARGGYVTALTDFRTAGLDLRNNNVNAALLATENGITADQKATAILTSQVEVCRH